MFHVLLDGLDVCEAELGCWVIGVVGDASWVCVLEVWCVEHCHRHARRPFHDLWSYVAHKGGGLPASQDHDAEDGDARREEQGHCGSRSY